MKRTPVIPFLGLMACICMVLSACQKEYSIETNVSLAAEGTLTDTTTGQCLPDSVVGTFYGGVEPGRDTAYVLVNVNVTNAGTYTIYTNTQNGFYLSDSGFFANTGINTIKLKPVGTPIIPGPTDFSITFDSSVCGFTINVKDSTGTGVGGGGITDPNESDTAWKFTGPAGSYSGPAAITRQGDTTVGTITYHYLYILGTTKATGDSALQLGVSFPGGAITTGSYSSTTGAVFNFQDGVAGTVIYEADPTTPTLNTIVNINSYDSATGIVTGTFSGTAKDSSGNTVNISSGTFTIKVQ